MIGWLLLSTVGFVVLTGLVVALARSDTARWERRHGGRSQALVRARPPARPLPHAHRRRRDVHHGPGTATVPFPRRQPARELAAEPDLPPLP